MSENDESISATVPPSECDIETDLEPVPQSQSQSQPEPELSLLKHFTNKTPLKLIFICLLYAASVGATMSIIPEVTTEKFAQIHHGYQYNCTSFPSDNEKEKPKECIYGASDAQQAAAYSSGVVHL